MDTKIFEDFKEFKHFMIFLQYSLRIKWCLE